MIKAVSANVQRIEKEWKTQCAFIAASEEGSKEKIQMKKEIALVRSKLEQEIWADLSEMEEEMKALDREIVEVIPDLRKLESIMELPDDSLNGLGKERFLFLKKKLNGLKEKKGAKEKQFLRVLGEYSKLLLKLEQDMKEIFIDDGNVSAQPAATISSMVTEDKLTIMATLSEKLAEASGPEHTKQ